MELIDKAWRPGTPVRLLSVTALSLTDSLETYEQTNLFAPQQREESARRENLERAVDAIRKKYGGKAITYGEAPDQVLHNGDREE